MKKELLSKFIEKYHLNGNVESAKIISKDNIIESCFVTEDQNVVGTVSLKNFGIEDCQLGVYTTSQLIKMLSALDDDIDIKLNKTNEKTVSLSFKDKDTNVSYMLSDISIIKNAPKPKTMPDFGISIKLSKEFIEKFIKAKNALPDADNFAITSNGTDTKIVLNYSTINTNRITFDTQTEKTQELKPLTFSAKVFKEILIANKNAETGILEVSEKGLARVSFKEKEYEAVYFLVQLQHS